MFFFYLLIGAVLLYLGLLALRTVSSTPPAQLVQIGKWVAGALVVLVALFFLATGRAANALETLVVLAPLFVRWRSLWQSVRNAAGPKPGQSSKVETGWLRMSLDHDSGAMDGVVLQGARRGVRLSECGRDDLLALLAEQAMETDVSFTVPPGTALLRVTLNGRDAGSNDLDLYIRAGAPATTATYDDHSENQGVFEGTEIAAPAAGIWYAHIDHYSGDTQIPYQMTATAFQP